MWREKKETKNKKTKKKTKDGLKKDGMRWECEGKCLYGEMTPAEWRLEQQVRKASSSW